MTPELLRYSYIPIAIIGLVILETIALLKGIDGTLFSMVIACISGLAGFKIGREFPEKEEKKYY